MLKVYRLSEDGFVAKPQLYFYNKWLSYLPQQEKLCNFVDWMSGLFVFLGKPSTEEARLELNKLSYKDWLNRKWWQREIFPNSIAYPVYNPQQFIIASQIPYNCPCYLPAYVSVLKITPFLAHFLV